MKKLIFSVFVVCFSFVAIIAQTKNNETFLVERSLNNVQEKQVEFDKKLQRLSTTLSKSKYDILRLEQRNEILCESIDSLKNVCDSLKEAQIADCRAINSKIQKSNDTIASNRATVENRTLWGGIVAVIILCLLLTVSYYLFKRIKRGTSSIDEMRMAQDALQNAHVKMLEESVKLDNKMIELCEQQIRSAPIKIGNTQIDHSLALKVADEIVRIEMNLSRMDASVKGYKQLTKAVQRIKDNFNANGYEIVDMLGKPYNAGMKVVANFAPDEKLSFGTQIITGIIKPQINYNGQMIQAAQITVSQNI